MAELQAMQAQEWSGKMLYGSVLNGELLTEIISTPPEEMSYVDTLDELVRFDFSAIPMRKGLVEASAIPQLCENMYFWAGPHINEDYMYTIPTAESVADGYPLFDGDIITRDISPRESPFGVSEFDSITEVDVRESGPIGSDRKCTVLHTGFSSLDWSAVVHLELVDSQVTFYLGYARYIHTLAPYTPLSEVFAVPPAGRPAHRPRPPKTTPRRPRRRLIALFRGNY